MNPTKILLGLGTAAIIGLGVAKGLHLEKQFLQNTFGGLGGQPSVSQKAAPDYSRLSPEERIEEQKADRAAEKAKMDTFDMK